MRARDMLLAGVGSTIKPPPASWANAATAASISSPGSRWTTLRDSQPKSRCDALDFAPYGAKSKKGGVQSACYPPQAGADLRQQLQPFAADFRFERSKASDVSAGMRKTLNQTGTYRVDNDYEYDWDAASCPLQRSRCQCAVGHDHVRRQGHELRDVSARAIR